MRIESVPRGTLARFLRRKREFRDLEERFLGTWVKRGWSLAPLVSLYACCFRSVLPEVALWQKT